jgi:hypothetical protein
MSTTDLSLPPPRTVDSDAAPSRFASFATQSRERTAAAQAEPVPTRDFAGAIAESKRGGWDPREVWLNRVHKPREGRRAW